MSCLSIKMPPEVDTFGGIHILADMNRTRDRWENAADNRLPVIRPLPCRVNHTLSTGLLS